jgi:hypothetical protein
LDNGLKGQVIKDIKKIGMFFVIGVILFQMVFFRENFLVVLRAVFSLFWIFLIPGFSIMYHWREKIDFFERIAIGIAASAGLIGISSYYIGLIGMDIKYHGIVLPAAILVINFSILIFRRK